MSTRVKRFIPAIAVLVAVAVLPALAAAQTPNLSGTWTFNADMSQVGGGGRGGMGGGGGDMVIKQEGVTISIKTTRMGRDGEPTTSTQTFTTDGKPVTSEAMGGRGGPSTVTAKWDGMKLVVSTARSMGDQSFTSSQTYSLSSDGKMLTVESERPGRGGGAATQIKMVYNKK